MIVIVIIVILIFITAASLGYYYYTKEDPVSDSPDDTNTYEPDDTNIYEPDNTNNTGTNIYEPDNTNNTGTTNIDTVDTTYSEYIKAIKDTIEPGSTDTNTNLTGVTTGTEWVDDYLGSGAIDRELQTTEIDPVTGLEIVPSDTGIWVTNKWTWVDAGEGICWRAGSEVATFDDVKSLYDKKPFQLTGPANTERASAIASLSSLTRGDYNPMGGYTWCKGKKPSRDFRVFYPDQL
jgi:hypothetical protein